MFHSSLCLAITEKVQPYRQKSYLILGNAEATIMLFHFTDEQIGARGRSDFPEVHNLLTAELGPVGRPFSVRHIPPSGSGLRKQQEVRKPRTLKIPGRKNF